MKKLLPAIIKNKKRGMIFCDLEDCWGMINMGGFKVLIIGNEGQFYHSYDRDNYYQNGYQLFAEEAYGSKKVLIDSGKSDYSDDIVKIRQIFDGGCVIPYKISAEYEFDTLCLTYDEFRKNFPEFFKKKHWYSLPLKKKKRIAQEDVCFIQIGKEYDPFIGRGIINGLGEGKIGIHIAKKYVIIGDEGTKEFVEQLELFLNKKEETRFFLWEK